MADKVIRWLEAAGKEVKKVAVVAVGKALPVAVKVAEEAEPLVDLVLPAEGAEFNAVVQAVISTEQAYAALGKQNGTGTDKLQAVLSAVSGTLLPKLEKAGLTGDAATAEMTRYVGAVVNILNGPAVAASKS